MVEPRIAWKPPAADTKLGDEAIAFCEEHKIALDEWQQVILRRSVERNPDGKWPLEVGVNVPRQNGKGELVLARLLIGVFVLEQPLQIYSAHEFATASEHFQRLEWLLEETPSLYSELARNRRGEPLIKHSHGEEGLEFTDRRRIRFRTRTKGGGRGFTCNTLIGDEAMIFSEIQHGALFPTLSAVPNAQIWYLGSAVDQEQHEHGVVFARVRKRGMSGDDPSLAYFEWSVDDEGKGPESLSEANVKDPVLWGQANPALGIRIDPAFVENEQRAMSARSFAVERLGVGDWPRTDHVIKNPLDYASWSALADKGGVIQEPVVVVFDVSPERKAAVVIAGRRKDGLAQGELVESKGGTAWVAPEVARIAKKHRIAVVCDGRGPAASLVPELRDLGVEVEQLSSSEHAQACGHLMDAVERQAFRHLDDPALNGAVLEAVTRPLGDAWAWSRKDSSTNIAPLVAFTLAISGALTREKPPKVAYAFA
jgi:phage terminase large subunit-like protein